MVVVPVIAPVVVGVILDRVGEIPNAPAGGSHQVLHRAVLKERSFKRSLLLQPLVVVWGSCRAGPDLGDVAVAALELRQARLRAYDSPTCVVDQAVGRHVATDVGAVGLVVI